jgi:hypothetical protein
LRQGSLATAARALQENRAQTPILQWESLGPVSPVRGGRRSHCDWRASRHPVAAGPGAGVILNTSGLHYALKAVYNRGELFIILTLGQMSVSSAQRSRCSRTCHDVITLNEVDVAQSTSRGETYIVAPGGVSMLSVDPHFVSRRLVSLPSPILPGCPLNVTILVLEFELIIPDRLEMDLLRESQVDSSVVMGWWRSDCRHIYTWLT